MMNYSSSFRFEPIPHPEGEKAVLLTCLQRLAMATSFLDVGCGDGKYTHAIKAVRPNLQAMAVDGHGPTLFKVHADMVWLGPLPSILSVIPDQSVDAVICLDVIEHLPKDKAIEMIKDFDRIARQVIVLFTPYGFMPQEEEVNGNQFMRHLCGFEPHELEALGYETFAWKNFNYGAGKEPWDALWGVRWP